MKRFTTLLIAALTALPACADTTAFGGPTMFKVTEKKNDVTINFVRTTVGANFKDEDSLDALIGITRDFKGQEMMFWAELNGSVPEERMMQLMNKQGRLEGVLQCKMIQIGTGPTVPKSVKFGVSGHNCTIKKINF